MFGDGVATKRVLRVLELNGVSVDSGKTDKEPVVLKRGEIVETHYFYDSIPREQLDYLARKFGVSLASFFIKQND